MPHSACDALDPPNVTLAVERDGVIIYTDAGIGVKPLLTLYRERSELLVGASVADTVVGKAAAVLLVLGRVSHVHGRIMSCSAKAYLQAHGIGFSCDDEVPGIVNRTGDGSCPLEAAVLEISDPHCAYGALAARVEQLMNDQIP